MKDKGSREPILALLEHLVWPSAKTQLDVGPRLVGRLAAAVAVFAVGSVAIWLGPLAIDWKWVLDHPNRLALQALCEASVILAAVEISIWKWQVFAAAGAPLIALLGLLGR